MCLLGLGYLGFLIKKFLVIFVWCICHSCVIVVDLVAKFVKFCIFILIKSKANDLVLNCIEKY